MNYLDKQGLTHYDGLIKNKINTKEDTSNKVSSLTSSSTDTEYPSAKCVYELFKNAGLGVTFEYDADTFTLNIITKE